MVNVMGARMNRRGHIPTILLLVAAIFLAVISLFSFYFFGNGVSSEAENFYFLTSDVELSRAYIDVVLEDSIEKAAESANDQGSFMKNFRNSFEEAVLSRKEGFEDKGNFFAKVREGDYQVFDNDKGNYEILIENVFVKPVNTLTR